MNELQMVLYKVVLVVRKIL